MDAQKGPPAKEMALQKELLLDGHAWPLTHVEATLEHWKGGWGHKAKMLA